MPAQRQQAIAKRFPTKAAQSQLIAFERKGNKLYSNFQFADASQGSLIWGGLSKIHQAAVAL